MGRKRDLSPRKIGMIRTLLAEKSYTQQEIAQRLGISQTSVNRIKNSENGGQLYAQHRAGKCGRRKILSPRTTRKLKNIVISNRKLTSADLSRTMEQYGVNISPRSVRRELFNMGLKAKRPRKKAKITPSMASRRLQWAKRYENWSADEWKKVCFSDESIFSIAEETSQYVRRREGEAFKVDCIQQTVKHPTAIMVWSVISWHGCGEMYIVEGTMKHDQYLKVLKNKLIPQMDLWYGGEDCIFMQDGAPCHRAKKILDFLDQKGIEVLDWPGNSPDMNPIENMWAIVKKKLKKTKITTRDELISKVHQVWLEDNDVRNMCQTLIMGMPKRIKSLIQSKGWHTKY